MVCCLCVGTQRVISFLRQMMCVDAMLRMSDDVCWQRVACVTGTQRVISFLRQMMEHGGFYRTSDQAWVQFERIQFVGACNPPTDPGRKPLSHRSVCCNTHHNCQLIGLFHPQYCLQLIFIMFRCLPFFYLFSIKISLCHWISHISQTLKKKGQSIWCLCKLLSLSGVLAKWKSILSW